MKQLVIKSLGIFSCGVVMGQAEHDHSVFETGAFQIALNKFEHTATNSNNPLSNFGYRSSRNTRSMPDLLTVDYGCFCRNLVRVTPDFDDPIDWYQNIGHPVDEIDKACKSLMDGYVCLKNSGVDISTKYVSPNQMLLSVEEAVSECERLNQGDDELTALCMVEEKFAANLVNLIFMQGQTMDPEMNPVSNENDRKDICHPGNHAISDSQMISAMGGGGGGGGGGAGGSYEQEIRNAVIDLPKVYCCDKGLYPEKSVISNTVDKCDGNYVEPKE